MPWNPAAAAEPGHACFGENRMNIGEPIRELEVEPLLYPAALPEAPSEPNSAPDLEPEPVEVPE